MSSERERVVSLEGFRPIWVPDEEVTHCTICKAEFGFFTRKHHCRQCGKIFCSDCSQTEKPLPSLGYQQKVRVCDVCHRNGEFRTPRDDPPTPSPTPATSSLSPEIKTPRRKSTEKERGAAAATTAATASPTAAAPAVAAVATVPSVVMGNAPVSSSSAAEAQGEPTDASTTTAQSSSLVTEELYENQRRGITGKFASGPLVANSDPPAWSLGKDDDVRPGSKDGFAIPPGAEWTSEWTVDNSVGDEEGSWEYSFDFKKKFSVHPFTSQCTIKSFVRRRRWIRTRTKEA